MGFLTIWISLNMQKYKNIMMSMIPMIQTAGKINRFLYRIVRGKNWSYGLVPRIFMILLCSLFDFSLLFISAINKNN